MRLLKRCFFGMASDYKPVRGRILDGMWEKVIKQQKFHNENWKKSLVFENRKKVKVPVVEAFREYIQENPLVQMYLQAGLDAIPEIVE